MFPVTKQDSCRDTWENEFKTILAQFHIITRPATIEQGTCTSAWCNISCFGHPCSSGLSLVECGEIKGYEGQVSFLIDVGVKPHDFPI